MKKLCDNEMKLEFLSKSCNESFARITVAAFAAQLDPTIEELSDIICNCSSTYSIFSSGIFFIRYLDHYYCFIMFLYY